MEGQLKREAMRRRSIETQQIASWTKEQILQDIENLKNGSLGQSGANTPQKPVEELKSPTNDAASKLSKLSARKIKNLAVSNGNGVRLNFDAIQQGDLSVSKPRYNVGFDLPSDRPEEPFRPVVTNYGGPTTNAAATSTTGVATGNPDIDAMIQEKKYFLSRLNSDNEKMAQLLQDMRECKQRLKATIQSVEAERDRLKGYQVDISSSCIDQFLMEGSEGALSALLAFETTDNFHRLSDEQREERRAAAEEMQRAMLALIARHKANQHEQNELIFARIQALCSRFTQDFDASVGSFENEIAQLRALIDVTTGPALANAGELLSQHIVDAVVEYAAGHKAVTAAATRNNVMLKDPSRSALKQSEGGRGDGSTPTNASTSAASMGSVTLTQAEYEELLATIESQKASLAKMSKSNAQLRAAAAASPVAAATTAAASGGASGRKNPSPLKRGQSSSSVNNTPVANSNGNTARDTDEQSDFDPTASSYSIGNINTGSGRLQHSTSTGSLVVPPVSPAKPIKVALQLPAPVVDYLHAHLTAHIQQLLEGHPIAATGIPVDVFHETAKELASQVQSLAATALVSYAHHRGIEDLMTCVSAAAATSSTSSSGGDGLSAVTDAAVRGVIQDGVKHTVQVAAVHAEITTLATLYLTYLHSRYGSDGKPRTTASGTTAVGAAAAAGGAAVATAAISPVAGGGSPHELGSASRDTLEYDPSGYTGFGDSGELVSGGTPYVRGSNGSTAGAAAVQQGRLGPVSHGAREYTGRSMSSSNVLSSPSSVGGGAGRKSAGGSGVGGTGAAGGVGVPRYMQPKRANTMGANSMSAAVK